MIYLVYLCTLTLHTFHVHSHAQNTENKSTLQILQTVEFVLNHNSANIPKLVCQWSIDIARVLVSFRKTFISTPGHFKDFCLPFMADAMIFFFFAIHFVKLKHYARIYSINLASCKIRLLNSNGNDSRQKNIYCKDLSLALNYLTPKGTQSNSPW